MVKIAISGKVNSGKDTFANIISDDLIRREEDFDKIFSCKKRLFSFSDPIKKIAKIMFPQIEDDWLYGNSDLRKSVIPDAFKDNYPLTVRQLLIDIGTEFGRSYNKNIWVSSLLEEIERHYSYKDVTVVTDCRFRNEFDALKNNGFIMIRIKRDNASNITHISDSEQDDILDDEFDYVVDNNGSYKDLCANAKEISQKIFYGYHNLT